MMRAFLDDPRLPQILVLSGLVIYGTVFLDFVIDPWSVPVALGAALTLEGAVFRFRRAPDRLRPPYPSALISALSTILLFRSTDAWAYAGVAGIAIASKVLIRVRGRHFVNPTNGAVLVGSLVFPGWIASGQWGHDVLLLFCLTAGAALILTRAGRVDSAVAFLLAMLGFQVLRHFLLGYRWASVLHQFTNGALWLFALYMITDPRTTPSRRSTRIAHAAGVAFLGSVLAQFFYVRDSFLWSLLALAPTVPLFDWLTGHFSRRHDSKSAPGGLVHDPSFAASR